MLNHGPRVHFVRFTTMQNRPGPVKYGPPLSSAIPLSMSHQKPLEPILCQFSPFHTLQHCHLKHQTQPLILLSFCINFFCQYFPPSLSFFPCSTLSSPSLFSQSLTPPHKHFLINYSTTQSFVFTIFTIFLFKHMCEYL